MTSLTPLPLHTEQLHKPLYTHSYYNAPSLKAMYKTVHEFRGVTFLWLLSHLQMLFDIAYDLWYCGYTTTSSVWSLRYQQTL